MKIRRLSVVHSILQLYLANAEMKLLIKEKNVAPPNQTREENYNKLFRASSVFPTDDLTPLTNESFESSSINKVWVNYKFIISRG